MEKIVIFGAGGFGKRYLKQVRNSGKDEVVCFLDNSKQKQNTDIDGVRVYPPEMIKNIDYTVVVVVSPGFELDIVAQLKTLGVDEKKIDVQTAANWGGGDTRRQWLVDYAKIVYSRDIRGNVAEAGVFRGDFAMHINAQFPDKTLYLFDTFEGFPSRDVAKEAEESASKQGYYGFTDEETVLRKLPYPEKAVLRKGYFPNTAEGIDDEFCFVNLDLDLYQPTLEGLKFFYGKMREGGVILIHDYYSTDFPNVKTAVADFEKHTGQRLKILPIGDTLSIAVVV